MEPVILQSDHSDWKLNAQDIINNNFSLLAALIFLPGMVIDYAGSIAPSGFLLCDGSEVSRTTYASLFAAIGTAYGAGDGSTTFKIPDKRQRFSLGKAASGTGNKLGDTGGNIDHTHTVDPPETNTSGPSATSPATALLGDVASNEHIHTVNIPEFNSGAANPPYIVFNSIIKT